MSEQELLFSFLIGLIIVSLAAMVLSVLQWRKIDNEAQVSLRMRKLRGNKQPSVTVLVYTRNQKHGVVQTLRAVKNNYYHNFDIVLIDDASSDGTSTVVREFMSKNVHAPIRLLRRRKYTTISQALQAGYRKSRRGSIVLPIRPNQTVDANYIKRAVASRTNGGIWQVSTHERLSRRLRMLDIGIFLEKYLWQLDQKARAYDAIVFKRMKLHGKNPRFGYLLRTILGSLFFGFVLLVGFTSMDMQLLWYVWIIVTAYGLIAVWLRYGETLRDRVVMTLSLPLALFLVPTTSVILGVSQLLSRK